MELRKYILKICVSPQSRRLSCGAVFNVKAIVLCCGLWAVASLCGNFLMTKGMTGKVIPFVCFTVL